MIDDKMHKALSIWFCVLFSLITGCALAREALPSGTQEEAIIENCNGAEDSAIYESVHLNFTATIPSSWVVTDGRQNTIFRLNDYEPRQETDPFIYVEEYPRNGLSFEQVVKAHVSEELWEIFEYESTNYNNYPAFITTKMPSMSGAYVVFMETETRYLVFGLTPWRDEGEPEEYPSATEAELCALEAMLQTVVIHDPLN